VLRAPGLDLVAARFDGPAARTGELALAAARSWSNALTVSLGIVAVVGGPLRTGRGRSIEQIVRVTAPMHEGFAGGAVIGAGGALIGIATAAQIRGLGVVIPAALATKIAAHVLEHGRPRMGFLGIAGQTVALPANQRGDSDRDSGLLVMGVTPGGPAEAGGVLVGDLVLDVDGRAIRSVDDLLEGLGSDAVGKQVRLTILRGGATRTVTVTVAERPAS
jgi:S1-C subfamily serine protease